MNGDEIVYTKGQKTSFFGDPNEYEVIVDVTKDMLNQNNGDMSKFVKIVSGQAEETAPAEAVTEPPAEQPAAPAEAPSPSEAEAPAAEAPVTTSPVGEEVNVSLVRDEMTRGDYLRMLFGTSSPNIMHLFSLLRKEVSNATSKLTGTWPIEQMIAFSKYSFSIVKMKNGRFYRVFVAHTDHANLANSTWLETNGVKDRWFELYDIHDYEIGRVLDARERHR